MRGWDYQIRQKNIEKLWLMEKASTSEQQKKNQNDGALAWTLIKKFMATTFYPTDQDLFVSNGGDASVKDIGCGVSQCSYHYHFLLFFFSLKIPLGLCFPN